MTDVALGLTLRPETVAVFRPHVEAAGQAFERLGDALWTARLYPTPENRRAAREAHDDLLGAQRAFDQALASEGFRTDRAHSFVPRNVLTCLRDDYGVSEHAARAVRLHLFESPPWAEDRLTLPDKLIQPWTDCIGALPA